ncbi:hypothetical protein CEXT_305791 [Caerostris extrusa]|uniref:Uncharacterized protein n=1 Tax=Caerostris extrusa TaxID=172846 RepID=A0AAV4Y1P0_CAEEX|nr:hypothetical protein CEXT_305791 [Caerostris extrusa]
MPSGTSCMVNNEVKIKEELKSSLNSCDPTLSLRRSGDVKTRNSKILLQASKFSASWWIAHRFSLRYLSSMMLEISPFQDGGLPPCRSNVLARQKGCRQNWVQPEVSTSIGK